VSQREGRKSSCWNKIQREASCGAERQREEGAVEILDVPRGTKERQWGESCRCSTWNKAIYTRDWRSPIARTDREVFGSKIGFHHFKSAPVS